MIIQEYRSFRSRGKSLQFCGRESFKKYILLHVMWPQLATTRVLCRLLRTFEVDFNKIYIARVTSEFSRARLHASFGLGMGAQSGCADFFAAPYACQLEKALPHSDPQSSNTEAAKVLPVTKHVPTNSVWLLILYHKHKFFFVQDITKILFPTVNANEIHF